MESNGRSLHPVSGEEAQQPAANQGPETVRSNADLVGQRNDAQQAGQLHDAHAHEEPVVSENEDDDLRFNIMKEPTEAGPSRRWMPAAGTAVTRMMVQQRQKRREALNVEHGMGEEPSKSATERRAHFSTEYAQGLPPSQVPLRERKLTRPTSAPLAPGGGAFQRPRPFPSRGAKPPPPNRMRRHAPLASKRATSPVHAMARAQGAEVLAEEVSRLKKALMQMQFENRDLRVVEQQMHAEIRRVERQADEAVYTGIIFDGLASGVPGGMPRADSHLIKALKQQVRELQRKVKDKEAELESERASAKSARLRELQVQTRVYFEEVRRLQLLLKLEAESHDKEISAARRKHDADAHAMRSEHEALRSQNAALDDQLGRWMDENDELRTLVKELEAKLAGKAPAHERDGLAQRTKQQVRERVEAQLKAAHRQEMERLREEMVTETAKLIAELDAEQSKVKRLETANRKLKHQNEIHCKDLAEAIAKLEMLRGPAPAS